MSIRATISAVLVAFAALMLVALMPTGAAAHGSVPHVHAAKGSAASTVSVAKADMVVRAGLAEFRAQMPASSDFGVGTDTPCSDRGCCSAGHCAGCTTAIAPSVWTCLRASSHSQLLHSNAAAPVGLAREGPPRPPKFFA
ncbi:hypothetical protein [Pseudorhodoplanes sp.]|uniref:hypothetical protein n=1 Tax=Pseudorhodoplanes sp. TaxID=1934341 RepID=UPI002BC0B5A5|nr:hypothetical protein [Pseudorhodoplanes sp.]HWV54257.1 hypothetical protein [Pseudorhodoplanes sp.]